MSDILYTSTATTSGGLEGKVQSSDGVINWLPLYLEAREMRN